MDLAESQTKNYTNEFLETLENKKYIPFLRTIFGVLM